MIGMFSLLMAAGMLASAGMVASSFRLDVWEIQLGLIPLAAIIVAAFRFGWIGPMDGDGRGEQAPDGRPVACCAGASGGGRGHGGGRLL